LAVEYRQLGHDGPHITRLTFGAWPIGGGMGAVDEATAAAAVHRALDLGVTAIDTAEYYRDSEAILGRALRGRPRDGLFLATKVSRGPFTRERVREALESSLGALGTDYVDLYQLHSYPRDAPLEEAIAALAESQASGRARYVGVSNFTAEELDAARKLHPIQSVQPRLSIFDPEHALDLLPYCATHNVGVIVHSPLAKGLLTGRYRPGHVFPPDDERSGLPRFRGEAFAGYLAAADELAALAREKGATLVQLAIAWTLVQPGVTSCIVGAKSPAQVEEQIGGVELRQRLDERDLRRIAEIADLGRRAPG
jgi:aryl-alcohol dehydrogenase-like predicted oxidoreductase